MSREEKIFESAAALPAPERPAYLDTACAGQPELRLRVESLLRSHEFAGFMAEGVTEACGAHFPDASYPGSHAEQSGTRIGRYQLLQQIGEGGFGTVWMAEQVEPVTRQVALKIIKAGMDTKEVIARFEAERQALAMMDHPNIAKVFDAGATGQGRPFFVMELVKGIPITKFCDEQQFTTRQRLELFSEVCSAINHAHQKGIIHRDIKPSNVMVTFNGDRPVVKVIDFGIAKATQGRLTEKTLFTRFEQFMGTPAYMSPEQSGLPDYDIDTRSDIYSLGVLLYELLTGTPPFDIKALVSSGYEEMRRIIREVEPPRPSSRLASSSGDGRAALARFRRIPPDKLQSIIEPDLDWIVMKAIEKDRGRRYETANGLALDILRYLEDEPVSASPPSHGYRFRKFMRRNKVALRAAGLVATALTAAVAMSSGHTSGIAAVLITTTTFSIWLAVSALQAGKTANQLIADERAAKEEVEAIAGTFALVFQNPDPARDGHALTVSDLLGRAALKADADSIPSPGGNAVLYHVLGRTYYSLGLYREAIPLLEKCRHCMDRRFGTKHRNSIKSLGDLARSYHAAGRWDEALQLQKDGLRRNRSVYGPEHPETLACMAFLAESYYQSDHPIKALELRKTVMAALRRTKGADHPQTISAAHRVAESYLGTGELLADAVKLEESALALSRKILGPWHPDTLFGIHILGHCMEDSGDLDSALRLREEEVVLRKKVLGSDHSSTLHGLMDLARSCYNAGRREDALNMQSEALVRSRKVLGSSHPFTIQAVIEAASLQISAGRRETALHLMAEIASRPVRTTLETLRIATLQAWLGLDSDHVTTCRKMFAGGIISDEPPSASRAAIACCIRPLSDQKLIVSASTQARNAVDAGGKEPGLPWFLLSHGMAQFRLGNYGPSEHALATAGDIASNLKMASERAHLGITSRLFRVMCLVHKGRESEARKLFDNTSAQIKPLPVAGQAYNTAFTYNDMILWLAFREAGAPWRQKSPRISRTRGNPRQPSR